MTGIVDEYRKHKDQLSVYFQSEADAVECERRANAGDDRAIRLLSLAYNIRVRGKLLLEYSVGGMDTPASSSDLFNSYIPINEVQRNLLHMNAKESGNFEALEFDQSVTLGNRSCLSINAETRPVLVCEQERFLEKEGTRSWDPISGEPGVPEHAGMLVTHIMPARSLRYEVATNRSVTIGYQDVNASNFHLLFEPGDIKNGQYFVPQFSWLPDRHSLHAVNPDYWQLNTKYLTALQLCAIAGDAKAAERLASAYGQEQFQEIVTKEAYFSNKKSFMNNPAYDSVKARQWQRVAEHLSGQTTAIEGEKFLKDFLYSQDGTPEGLYNIGYALYHNEHIGNKARGMDYLKHAANLGDVNAARELGEIYHNAFDSGKDSHNIELAYFWYSIAAEHGHPNGKARSAFLSKEYPQVLQAHVNEAEVRNPSPAHIAQYPASAWHVEVPITDISHMMNDTSNGDLVARMQKAVTAMDNHAEEFERATALIQAKIDDLIARQVVMDGRVEALKGEEITALRHNDGLSEKQRVSQRAAEISSDRWIKETMNNMGGTIIYSLLAAKTGGTSLIFTNAIRAAGYRGVRNNEVDYHQAMIEELEARKIDTSKFPAEIKALTEAVQQVADSVPIQKLMKDETRSRAIVEGYLRQRILKSGLEACRGLEDYAKQNGLENVDALLAGFEHADSRLHAALDNLCHGVANSNDMAVILADANAMHGDLQPHEKALKRYVERVVKGNISHFMTRASQIDVISDLNLVDFDSMTVNHANSSGELVHAMRTPTAEEQGARQVDAATKLALTSMFSKQFGVTHVGQYDVTRMFSYFLHRHGKDQFIAAELHDGVVSDEEHAKQVSMQTPKRMRAFVERAKESALRDRTDLPNLGDLFLRICGYEYYLPQAVITSGRGNRFAQNPEAPVAYPVVNRVVQSFIERMSLTDITQYREKIGEELDSVIAGTFTDFFKEVGREHAERFATEREYLRDAYAHHNYGPRFDTYEDKIADDILEQYPLFLKIYARNLQKHLDTMPEEDAKLLQAQIDSLDDSVKAHLNPEVAKPGSPEARIMARECNHRGTNMTEPWQFKRSV